MQSMRMYILHTAARDGHTETVRTLMSTAGALSLINTKDASGNTPLYCAAHNGHASVTEQMIEARCNLDHQDFFGCTPLYAAVQNGHASVIHSVIKQLMEAGCNIDVQTKGRGHTALHRGPNTIVEDTVMHPT